jgi:hypothetical protein
MLPNAGRQIKVSEEVELDPLLLFRRKPERPTKGQPGLIRPILLHILEFAKLGALRQEDHRGV